MPDDKRVHDITKSLIKCLMTSKLTEYEHRIYLYDVKGVKGIINGNSQVRAGIKHIEKGVLKQPSLKTLITCWTYMTRLSQIYGRRWI